MKYAPADYRLQGIAAALGKLAEVHFERDLAEMVLESLGLTVADLRKAGADEFDFAPLSATPHDGVMGKGEFSARET